APDDGVHDVHARHALLQGARTEGEGADDEPAERARPEAARPRGDGEVLPRGAELDDERVDDVEPEEGAAGRRDERQYDRRHEGHGGVVAQGPEGAREDLAEGQRAQRHEGFPRGGCPTGGGERARERRHAAPLPCVPPGLPPILPHPRAARWGRSHPSAAATAQAPRRRQYSATRRRMSSMRASGPAARAKPADSSNSMTWWRTVRGVGAETEKVCGPSRIEQDPRSASSTNMAPN